MSSTNKTTNYNLSQYIGSDKPTYLGDYNSDMEKIDLQMKTNADGITAADAKATTASTNASTALTNAGTAQTTAETAQTTATSALNKALQNENDIAKFNLTTFIDIPANTISVTGASCTYSTLKIATNSDGSIFKLYGGFALTNFTSSTINISIQTSLRPDEEFDINPTGICIWNNGSVTGRVENLSTTFKTTGELVMTRYRSSANYTEGFCLLFPCLYFAKSFGDVSGN